MSRKDGETINRFCEAFPDQNPEQIEKIFSDYLWKTISIRDTASVRKENFYHGILLGLLGYKANWLVKSNAESGIGYSDILVEVPDNRTGIVIELKYAENGDMEAACKQALLQIEDRNYAARLKDMVCGILLSMGLRVIRRIVRWCWDEIRKIVPNEEIRQELIAVDESRQWSEMLELLILPEQC